MNSLVKIFIGFTFLIFSLSLNAQRTATIYGIVLHSNDSTPIVNAHVINISSNKGVVSNMEGHFSIIAYPTDTLRISFIGSETLEIVGSDIVKEIYLKRKNQKLETFTVLPYKDFSAFKEAFKNLELTDNEPQINQSFLLSDEELWLYDGSSGISGGISGLLGQFNKYVQDKKNYERLIKQDKYKALLAKKFSPQLVKKSTPLKNSEVIQSFMEYCDFTNKFIELSSEYEIATAIIHCYGEFNSLVTKE